MSTEPKPFSLDLHYDGNYLHIDYCDGSDDEHVPVGNDPEKLKAAVLSALEAAAGEEAD